MNDYELVTSGLTGMLAPFRERVDVIRLISGHDVDQPFDIVLYDGYGFGANDLERLSSITDSALVKRRAVYTWNLLPALIDRALRDGASGYLSKTLPATELLTALEQIHAGRVVVSPAPTSTSVTTGGNWPGREHGLSYREGEVVALIAHGLSNAEIASSMFLSPNSVKSYIRSAYRKIGVCRRSQAVSWGIRHGLEPDNVHELLTSVPS